MVPTVKELVFFFIVFYGLERLVETFWKRKKVNGQTARYTLYLLGSAHIIVFVSAPCKSSKRQFQTASVLQLIVGLALVVAAMVCRNWSIATLGPYHSLHIEVRKEHPLITSGPYQYVRNPYYISNALELVGFPVVAHAQLALLLSLVIYMPSLLLRLLLEERALKRSFVQVIAATQAGSRGYSLGFEAK
jgi:isoprenylcysteine carboxyl methyltransferase (ICMT) family protein YpbQ